MQFSFTASRSGTSLLEVSPRFFLFFPAAVVFFARWRKRPWLPSAFRSTRIKIVGLFGGPLQRERERELWIFFFKRQSAASVSSPLSLSFSLRCSFIPPLLWLSRVLKACASWIFHFSDVLLLPDTSYSDCCRVFLSSGRMWYYESGKTGFLLIFASTGISKFFSFPTLDSRTANYSDCCRAFLSSGRVWY